MKTNKIFSLLAAIMMAATFTACSNDDNPVQFGQSDKQVIDLSKLTGDYKAQNGDILTGTNTRYKISIAADATVTLANANINGTNDSHYYYSGITCDGDATIILKDGTTNVVRGFWENHPGIFIPEGHTLTIKGESKGTGSLNASSNGWGAGIGGSNIKSCGNIVIQGGNITAIGGNWAAGIGGGDANSCGNITISGGTVTATGGGNSAGIGGGSDGASCGDITISGGTVTATGGQWGAGIGSGNGESDGASCGNITITGGTVTATGGEDGAGIGTGEDGASCGDITISGGTVTAIGKNHAVGIGTGPRGKCGDITITSNVTKVTATKGEDAPPVNSIGACFDGTCGTVTIEKGANVIQN